MPNQSFPIEVLNNPGHPYVYFNSLPDSVKSQVLGYFSQDISSFTNSKTGTSSIKDAFSFMQSAIATERAKEEAFIQYIKDKTKGTIKLEVPDINSDWSEFVKEVQKIISFGDTGLKNLQNEYNRLKKNEENYEKAVAKGEKQAWYQANALADTSKSLLRMIEDFKKKTTDMRNQSTMILTTILERYKDSLLVIKGDRLEFNRTELAALVLSITQIVMSMYNSQVYNLDPNKARRNVTQDSINEILDKADIDEQIKNFIYSFRNIPSFREDIISNYNLTSKNSGQKLYARPFADRNGQVLDDCTILAQNIRATLSSYEFPEKAIKLIKTTNVLAEVESALKFAMIGAFRSVNTGGAGAKPDNIIGMVTIDPKALQAFPEEKQKQIITMYEQISMRIDEMVKSLNKANTTEYYEKQAKQWNMISPQIDKLMESLGDILGYLPSCFVIEDSTKNYLSLYSRQEDGELSNAVHGGSLGAHLDDQLNKINALTQAGQISMVDKEWLTAAIINAGPNMIASGQKATIENYLAMFAAILLFDGQINIAEEAAKYMVENKLSGSSTHQIHLFSVNDGYYPLSYVLNLTYNSLTENLTRIEAEAQSEGVQVEIYGFVSEPSANSYNGLDSWESLSQAAQKSTKIKMKFLVRFQNIVANLLNLQ